MPVQKKPGNLLNAPRVYIYIKDITKNLLLSEVQLAWIQSFPTPRMVAIKRLVCQNINPQVVGKERYIKNINRVKHKWPCPKFELNLLSPVPIMIPVKAQVSKSKVGDPKAPFSIATTLRCGGGWNSFPGLLHFTLDPYLIMQSVKQGSIKYHFLSLWYDSTWDWTPVSQAIGKHSTL